MDFDALADSILEGQTILIIGSEITYNYPDPAREQAFFKEIMAELGETSLDFHQKDGLFILKNARKRAVLPRLKKFYEEDFSNPILEKIAEIPFHLILSLSPDASLHKVFERKGFDFEQGYYKLNQRETLAKPESSNPLIYQLFGSVLGGKDDMYLDHNDLFKYVRSIYNPQSTLPEAILSYFVPKKSDTLIFLGCNFDKWYFQLILNLLNIQDIESSTFLSETEFQSEWRTVYEQGFKLNFVMDNSQTFIDKLHQVFDKDELRKANPKGRFSLEAFKQQLNDLLNEGEYDRIFEAVRSQAGLNYDVGTFNRLQQEMSFKITFDLITQLKIFIGTLII